MFPRDSDITALLSRSVILNDTIVPEPQHIAMQFRNEELVQQYPAHSTHEHMHGRLGALITRCAETYLRARYP
jgi:hypothetical protein